MRKGIENQIDKIIKNAKKNLDNEWADDNAYRLDDKDKAKARITIWIDADVLASIKSEAKQKGGKYQTLINHTLRRFFLADDTNTSGSSIEATLINAIKELDQRVRDLEKKSTKRKKA